jgi:hypothetical protein
MMDGLGHAPCDRCQQARTAVRVVRRGRFCQATWEELLCEACLAARREECEPWAIVRVEYADKDGARAGQGEG